MADSFSKKENSKKKSKKLIDKTVRRELRKTNNNKGKSLDEMIVYVDVNGQFTSVPPHLQNREEDLAKAAKAAKKADVQQPTHFTGIITYFSEKGYGFITEDESRDNIFFHQKDVINVVQKHDKVTYKKEYTPKGYKATEIKK